MFEQCIEPNGITCYPSCLAVSLRGLQPQFAEGACIGITEQGPVTAADTVSIDPRQHSLLFKEAAEHSRCGNSVSPFTELELAAVATLRFLELQSCLRRSKDYTMQYESSRTNIYTYHRTYTQ